MLKILERLLLQQQPVATQPTTKRCSRCKTNKNLAEFNKCADGYQYWCRVCQSEHRYGNTKTKRRRHRVPLIMPSTLTKKRVTFCIANVSLEDRLELQEIAVKRNVTMEKLGQAIIKDFLTLHGNKGAK